jgi:hypothetical protein
MQQTCFVSLPASTNTKEYINVFSVSNSMINGVLVHNEKTLSQVYDDKRMPSIKYFRDFLP